MTPEDWFLKIKDEAVKVFPDLENTIFVKCDEIAKDTGDYRAYMHVFHVPHAICHAEQAKELSDANLEGIIWHEFGHLIAGEEGDECDADCAVLEEFKIEIGYDDKDLQFVRSRSLTKYIDAAEAEMDEDTFPETFTDNEDFEG